MWLVGVVVRRYYRFPHITYPYSSCISSFLQQHPFFLFIFKNVFVLVPVLFFVIKFNVLKKCSRSINSGLRPSHGSHMKGCT